MIKKYIVSALKKLISVALSEVNKTALMQRAAFITEFQDNLKRTQPDNPANYGCSIYSQNEEDGIIKRLHSLIGVTHPTFIEFGVHWEENNTTNLLFDGGRGVWVDKGLAGFKHRCPSTSRLRIFDEFVTKENIRDICSQARDFIGLDNFNQLDFLSLDLDGNDFYLVAEILQGGVTPKVLCLEYNAKFPPPQKIKILYNPAHVWTNDDYFGCSLQEYLDLLTPYGYRLVTCNMTGSNCFFVRREYWTFFPSLDPALLYQPPRPYLSPFPKGPKSSDRHLIALLTETAARGSS